MNRFVNIWTVIFFILSLPFAMALDYAGIYKLFGIEFPGPDFEYNDLIYGILAGIFLLLGALKASRRWVGLFIARQTQKFVWSAPLSKARKQRILMYSLLEVTVLVSMAVFYFMISPILIYVGLALVIVATEHLLHTFVGLGKDWFRVGITSKAVVSTDREVTVMYYTGLRKVSIHQQTLYLEYIKDLTLHIPSNAIQQGEVEAFKQHLVEQVDREKVFFNEAFKAWK
ncbi:hypothetical protein [Lishizhenia sp.]|uniref:hypothetical protein n=1 Tax=Lishizhenia sp. TaxID=2497594 RepID=UPI00299CEF21|nr:hypothetical protein [Lishizhenia sp.]MDX1446201.1 hypothetical protein [Lishizhenia sp.]